MIYVGIDVAKDKHDCIILGNSGEVLQPCFTFPNNSNGFEAMYQKIRTLAEEPKDIKIGLEATGHYSYNLLGYLVSKDLPTNVFNPLHTNQFRKALSLRKTKTDKVDAKTISVMLMSGIHLKPYTERLYHSEELKSLTRYRFNLIQMRAKMRTSVTRLINILFPELEDITSSLHSSVVYDLLSEFPGATYIAKANIIRLSNLVHSASRGYYGRAKAEEIRNIARRSIGSQALAKSFELKQTIALIKEYDNKIKEVEKQIQDIMDDLNPPILSIPGMGKNMAAMIIAEVGDFSNFASADKLQAFSGFSPSTYQSGNFESTHAKMEKRGSTYLRYALYNATKLLCLWNPDFNAYLNKKRAEGKHYNVAISHAAKRLIRLIYAMETSGTTYRFETKAG